ncbi:acetyltransferase [Burkholderia ubonensis]|uniref:acetyltransferase n=1 Tax=Burkholderia ubonensis TaxID=101571 RepID=UPI0008FDE270|nr:acetyltransferase [Burkholderia ubonensis]
MREKPLIIHGTGGHAKVVFDIARAAGFSVAAFVDPFTPATEFAGIPIAKTPEHAYTITPNAEYFVAVGDNAARERIVSEVTAFLPGILSFATLIHPSAVISPSAQIGIGTVVMPCVVVNAASKVGRHAILNTRSSLDHDSEMADYSSLAPNACTGGRVSIGRRSAISIGAIVKHGIVIGSDVVVGAASYIHNHTPDNVVVYGTPATVQKIRVIGDPYL